MEEWDDDRRRLDNPKGNESKKVVTPENKCRPENAQIHVNATLDHIYSPVAGLYLVLYATNHWKDPWYQANSPERDTGMFEYDPVGGNISEVHTYACVGAPGYVYMVGCLHEGFPSRRPLHEERAAALQGLRPDRIDLRRHLRHRGRSSRASTTRTPRMRGTSTS